LNPQEARYHPNVHVIRRYLGSSKTPRADIRMRLTSNESDTQSRSNQGLSLLPGDLLLLCTDGLTDVVEDAKIEPTVRGLDLRLAAQTLVDMACARGGKDNITVVLLLVPWQDMRLKQEVQTKKERKYWLWGLIGLFLLALFITGLAWVVFHFC
jgi:PPM family protein phosphatase